MACFKINCKDPGTKLEHYWEKCVGSCRAYTALRADYREQLIKAHRELGFQYVRFHGLLNDDMSVCLPETKFMQPTGKLIYNFFNIDSIFDFLLSIGMKPFLELGFMPSAIASGDRTCFHYKGNITPPKNDLQWEELIFRLAAHLVERYGIDEVSTWFFEVWNEPNLPYFWAGTQEEYFELYWHTAVALKNVDHRLKVGGPATSINAWIPDFLEFCQKNSVPVDFVSTHHYPSDDPLWRDPSMTMEEFFHKSETLKYKRGCLREMTERAKAQAGDLPLYYTEWNTSATCGDQLHDEPYAAAMIAKTLSDNDGLISGYSYWTFTDIFEEAGQMPGMFYGGFGLQNVYGVEKPSYRAFELFHGLGDRRLPVVRESGEETFVEMIAAATQHGIRLIAYNHNVFGEPIHRESGKIVLENAGGVKGVTGYRIDDDHANPKKKWAELGRPGYPGKEAMREIRSASRLAGEKCSYIQKDDTVEISFDLPEYGVLAIDIDF